MYNEYNYILNVDCYDNPVDLGCRYEYLSDMQTAFEGTASSNKELITDEWGTVLQGYGPVKNTQGETIAIIVVDMDASYIAQHNKAIGHNTNIISDKIQDVSAVSEENAAMSEEVSASSEEQNAAMQEMGATAEELSELSIKQVKDL